MEADRNDPKVTRAREGSRSSAGALRPVRDLERMLMLARVGRTLSHQLGSPLNVISGRVALARRSCADPSVLLHLESVDEQTRRITAYLEEFVAFVGRGCVVSGEATIAAVIESACGAVEEHADVRGVRLDANLESSAWVRVDRPAAAAALAYVLERALSRAPVGGVVSVRVVLDVPREAIDLRAAEGDYVAVDVRHEGNDTDTLDRRCLDRAPWAEPGAGSIDGLRLHLAHGVAETLGGWVEFVTPESEGEGVRLVLPRAAGGRTP